MAGAIIRPELPKLTPELKKFLKKGQPDDVILHYLQTGEITIDELADLFPDSKDSNSYDRKKSLQAAYEEWCNEPDPEELEAWEGIEDLCKDPFADQRKLEDLIEAFMKSYPKSAKSAVAAQKLADIARNRWIVAKDMKENSLVEMQGKLQQMKDTLDKYRIRWENMEIIVCENEIKALEERIAKEELRPLFEEWDRIVAMPENNGIDMHRKEQAMTGFIRQSGSKFTSDICNSLNQALTELSERIAKCELEDIRYNFDELVRYIRSQRPGTELFKKADEYLWFLATEELDTARLKKFIKHVPNSSYIGEANEIMVSLASWENVKKTNDIFAVQQYLDENHNAPKVITDDAETLRDSLIQEEMFEMEKNPSAYLRRRLFGLINIGAISVDDLVRKGLTTYEMFESAKIRDQFIDDNPLDVTFVDSPELETDGITDVYLFGVPSTGKTCVLMGLLGLEQGQYDWNNMIAAGEYGDFLDKFRDNHILPNRTKDEQFFCIHGKAKDRNGKEHLINLIELAGEQFLHKIAMNKEHELSLVDMDAMAAKSLKNDNRKIFFIIIDPTANIIPYETKDGTGKEVVYQVPQKTVIRKIVNILKNDANKELMKKVDALHFIATKSDVIEHANKDIKDCMVNYVDSIKSAHEMCLPENAHINEATGFKPKLYSFSLGKFYVGGTFEYDSTDSEKLMNVITENTIAVRNPSFVEKICDQILNYKLF